MTTNDFVTYEQAKALEELEFDWTTNYIYYKGIDGNYHIDLYISIVSPLNHQSIMCNAPTMAEACKWLREKKKIEISVRPNDHINDSGNYEIQYFVDVWDMNDKLTLVSSDGGITDFELALQFGIDDAIEYLKNN